MINMFLQLYMYLVLHLYMLQLQLLIHSVNQSITLMEKCDSRVHLAVLPVLHLIRATNDSSFLSKITCSQCPCGCKSCNSSKVCLKCKPGFRGQVCENRCSDGCIDDICDKEKGYCSCKTGYFGNSCTDKCPETCEACHSHSYCIVCKPGYYGETCTIQCPSGCLDITCNKSTGTCIKCIEHSTGFKCDQCLAGRYGTLCENKCPVNCATCNSSEYCSICNVGFHGYKCLNHCPDGCLLNSCDSSTGKCVFGCKPNCTGPKCEVCKPTKIDYDDNYTSNQKGHCYSCINGYFVKQCTHKCSSNCLNGSCDKNGTCYSCIDGYYGNGCVLRCPDKCNTCVNDYCRTCNADDQRSICQLNCTNCKLNQSCDFVTGQCDSCKDGFYGSFCNKTCRKQCSSCSSSGDMCITCNIGWYGIHNDNKTYVCNKRCSENCFNRSCDALNGSCDVGCNNEFWGQYCENKCSYMCMDRACHKDNGTCSNACIDGFYGPSCECPNYCNCSGYNFGCRVGKMRDFNCSDACLHLACRRDNDVCINGCRNERYDPECADEENGLSMTLVGIIITIVVIITAVVAACVTVAVKVRQRRRATFGEETVVNGGIKMIQQDYEDLIRNQGPVYINLQIGELEENQTTNVYEELTTTMT